METDTVPQGWPLKDTQGTEQKEGRSLDWEVAMQQRGWYNSNIPNQSLEVNLNELNEQNLTYVDRILHM